MQRCVSCGVGVAAEQGTVPAPPAPRLRRPAPPPRPASRTVCRRCDRALCLCDYLPEDGGAQTRTAFHVVQSRSERFNAISTGRLASLGLERCTLSWDTDADERLPRPPTLPADAGLLFPGAGSTLLSRSAPSTLVVVDATWAEAKRMLRHNDWLATLPRYALSPAPEERSTYRIRKQPAENCLSTVECVARVLQAVEPGPVCDAAVSRLLTAFDALVEKQLDKVQSHPRSVRRHEKRERTTPSQALARRGLDTHEPSVYAYAEFYCGRLLQWAALRRHTGEVFQAFVDCGCEDVRAQLAAVVAASDAPDSLWISHQAATAQGVPPAQFDAHWRAWLRPGERIAMWSAKQAAMSHPLGASVDQAPDAVGYDVPPLSLKEAYAALLVARRAGKPTRGPSSLAEAVEAEPLAVQAAAAAAVMVQGVMCGRVASGLAQTAGLGVALAAIARGSEE